MSVTPRHSVRAHPGAQRSAAPRAAVIASLGIAVGLAILATLDASGAAVFWELAHWTLFDLIALALAADGTRRASGSERRFRLGVTMALGFWFAGQIVWDLQVWLRYSVVPAPSDVLFMLTVVPMVWALGGAVRPHRRGRAALGLYLDAAVVLLATATVMVYAFGERVASSDPIATTVLLAMPVGFLSIAGAGLIVALATGAKVRVSGIYALLIGAGLLGAAYLPWVADAPNVTPPGSWTNLLFSAGAMALGVAGFTHRADPPRPSFSNDLRGRMLDALPAAGVAVALVLLVAAANDPEPSGLVRPLGWSVVVVAVLRQVILASERAAAVEEASRAVARAEAAAAEIARAEKRHRRVIEQIPATVYIDERRDRETSSQLVFISPQVGRLLGYPGDDLRATPNAWYSLVHPDDADRVKRAEDRHFETGEPLDQTFRMRSATDGYVWVRDEANLVSLPDGRRRSHGVLTDVTAQRVAEAQLRSSEEQQRRIIETASSAYVSINAKGLVVDWNESATRTFGWSRAEAIGRPLEDLVVPEAQRAAHVAGLRRYMADGDGPLVGQRVEVHAVDRRGRLFPVELTIWPVRVGDELTFSALIHDITDRRRLQEELRHQAFHDSLTGLANRALFMDRVSHVFDRRDGAAAAILYFDIDDFKLVNDGLGHAAGDALLIEVATRLSAILRPGDTAARLGGDEFALLIEDTDEAAATSVARRIVDLFAQPFGVADRRVAAQASVGVAIGRPGADAETLLRDADAAMYEAKRRGKGVWQLYHASLLRSGIESLELRADLKQAIGAGAITVAYQPIVDLATRQTVGVEALARWHHPQRGEVAPSTFIPIAESSELIIDLGLHVLTEACSTVQTLRATKRMAELQLSVNLSARQLLHPTIVDDVRGVLAKTGLHPTALTLEITEGVVVDDAGGSIAAIEGLKSTGVRIAIDDFGTGYSSLSYLSRLPIDALKIDRSFVAQIGASREATGLVRSIVRIGQTLHFDTVAEGIETEAQLEGLLRMGARLGQGYLFSRPVSGEELARTGRPGRTTRDLHRTSGRPSTEGRRSVPRAKRDVPGASSAPGVAGPDR